MSARKRSSVATVVMPMLFAAGVAVAPTGAHAQIASGEAACRAALTKAFGKYVKALEKGVATCHKARDKGALPPSYDCNDPSIADFAAKNKPSIALNAALNVAFSATCASAPGVLSQFPRCPAPFETIDDVFGGPGIDFFSELFDCTHLHADNVLSTAARTALGLPDAAKLPFGKELQKCHGALVKGFGKIVNATIKERNRCQESLDKSGGPLSFACATADPKGKIATAVAKALDGVDTACSPSALAGARLPDIDSCGGNLPDVKACALQTAATRAAGGAASLLWELPGVCPVTGTYQLATNPSPTDVDTGAPGIVHDMDPTLGYGGVRFNVSCDADCASCSTTSVDPAPGACRCNGDASVECSTNGDCSGFGGTCQCFYGPPASYSAGGSPVCVTTKINDAMSGGFDPGTGDLTLAIPAQIRIYLAISQFQPCPLCVFGVCDGGQRDGLGCSIDATDPTFGPVSYDCPPMLTQNISGAGNTTTFNYSTGTESLPFALACDAPFGGYNCACSTCSGNNQVACNSDAECATAGAGVCRTDGLHGGAFRSPNNCDDLVCSPDPNGEPNEGTCLAGPVDFYCDGALRSSGKGFLACVSQMDCDDFDSFCAGGDCGSCSLAENRNCFLDPIVAQGDPGHTIVGEGCMAPSNNAGINGACGWPGPYRIRQDITTELFCPDGVTPFESPGGSNCP